MESGERPVESPVTELARAMADFAKERDWDQFHTPKNLAAALAVEAAELLEHFQWLTAEQSATLDEKRLTEVAFELADVFNYTVRLADKLGIDLIEAARAKLAHSARKYPAARVRGKALKYHEYPEYTGDE